MGCKTKSNEVVPTPPRPVKVMYAKTLGTITKNYVGSVQATEFSELAFKLSGKLTSLTVNEGEKVTKGEIIATIDPYDFSLKLIAAEAQYTTAKQIYERTKALYQANAVAKQSLESAQAEYIQASSAVEIARNILSNTKLRAPFNGFIEQQFVENHEVIQVGQKIVKIINPSSVEIQFILPESNTMILELPKTIYIEFETIKGKLFLSEIKENIYASDGSGIPVTLKVTDSEFNKYRQDVFPGFSCKVFIEIDNNISNSFIIPSSAIMIDNQQHYVWIVDRETHRVHKRKVNAKLFPNQQAIVESGLKSNDIIVIAGVDLLHDNEEVTLQRP